jgi:dihydrofolate reductase
MNAGLLDELHMAEIPVMLNGGEKLFANPDSQLEKYQQQSEVISGDVIHRTYVKTSA